MLLAACIEELWFNLISLLISLLIISCPPRHMGLGFVSRLPSLVPVASSHRVCPRGLILMPLLLLFALGTGMGGMDTISMVCGSTRPDQR